jgi:predicted dehydrogenase
MTRPRIKIALVGLSASAKTSWASSAHLPYLLSPRGQERYQIIALLNSSESAARAAIAEYKLDPTTKAYGDPHDLAKDDEVELVVVTTRVDVHYSTIKPALEAGKNAYVEWPLADNRHRARELAEIAARTGARTMVGIQGRVSPLAAKLKQVLDSRVIGPILNVRVDAYTPTDPRKPLKDGLAYFFDKKVGGNLVTIICGHSA